MTQEKQHDIALMRYSLISPIINGLPEEYSSLDAFYRDAAKKGTVSPDGNVKHFSVATIERWYRNYKNGGFDALIPQGRVDEGKPRKLDADLQEQIKYLKQNYPRMSASAIFRQLRDNGSIVNGEVSESTVCRYINQLALERKTTTNRDMRRYERPHINEVWCGDSSVGPYLKTADGQKRKVYIIALIDDASRFIVGIDVFFNDNFVNLMSVIKSAVAKYGRPQIFNFDNGKSYRNKQMELLAARIGSVLHFDQPYTPTQKAKIERWFRTMKDQWMASLDIWDFHSLDELRGNLLAYVNSYNQTPHSSLKGKSPQERFFSEPECFHRLPEDELDRNFLLEIQEEIARLSLEKRKTPVIIIDEANYINNAILNDLKILFNFEMDSRDRAAILLAGLPKLNSTLRLTIHEPLYQRLVMNYNLEGLSKEEGRSYIHEKLKGAGCNRTVFHEAAVEAILNAADGTPRIINKLCNASLLIGDSNRSEIITADIAMQAINDCELG